jgi:ribulose bisphosphate carboxylase small subunit
MVWMMPEGKYAIINTSSLREHVYQVQEMLDQGWRLCGEMLIDPRHTEAYIQPMILVS